jgi:hypothetical protein
MARRGKRERKPKVKKRRGPEPREYDIAQFNSGRSHRRVKGNLADNPHPPKSWEYASWEAGWKDLDGVLTPLK